MDGWWAMMKRLLSLIDIPIYCFVIYMTGAFCFAGNIHHQLLKIAKSRVSAAGCSSPITFSYHMENSNDVTVGTPTGCSNGDEVGTETSVAYESSSPAPQDGTYSILFDGNPDNIAFDISGEDIFDDTAGNIDFYFYLDSFTSNREILRANGDGQNFLSIVIITNTDNELRLRYKGNNITVDLTTTGCDLSTGTWVHLIVRWTQADVDPNLFIDCNDGTTISDNTNLTDWTTAAATLTLGNGGVSAYRGNIDNLTIKDTYAD